jgi:hypothetical protein
MTNPDTGLKEQMRCSEVGNFYDNDGQRAVDLKCMMAGRVRQRVNYQCGANGFGLVGVKPQSGASISQGNP